MAGKTKQSEPKMRLDLRAKMYIVLVICSLMLLASVGVAFFLVGGFGSSEDAASDSAVEPESIITESGYNKEENTIDTTAYSATILPESSDAARPMWTKRFSWATAIPPACTACSTSAPTITPSARWA